MSPNKKWDIKMVVSAIVNIYRILLKDKKELYFLFLFYTNQFFIINKYNDLHIKKNRKKNLLLLEFIFMY